MNLVIIPLMSVVLGAGLLGSFLCLFFKPAGGAVFLLCRGILNLYEWSCNLSMKLPFSRIVTGKPEVSWIVLYYAVLLLVCLYWMLRKEKTGKTCFAWGMLAAAGICLAASGQMKHHGVFQATMLDV